jgi:hypothetical protein
LEIGESLEIQNEETRQTGDRGWHFVKEVATRTVVVVYIVIHNN